MIPTRYRNRDRTRIPTTLNSCNLTGKAEISGHRVKILLLTFVTALLCLPSFSQAKELDGIPLKRGVEPQQLDASIDRVINQPEYSWRLPRAKQVKIEKEKKSRFDFFMMDISKWFRKFGRWLEGIMDKIRAWMRNIFKPRIRKPSGQVDWQYSIQVLLFILLVIATCMLAIILLRTWKRRKIGDTKANSETVGVVPDILDENIMATELPSDEWMSMALDFLDRGELRFAIRAMFLACLAYLSHCEHLAIAAHKSNREYLVELNRKAHDNQGMLKAFTANVGILEQVWYGMHPATGDLVNSFETNRKTIMETDNEQQ